MHEKVGLEHSSKSTKYELEGSYGDPVHEHFSFLKTAKLPRECNEDMYNPLEKKLGFSGFPPRGRRSRPHNSVLERSSNFYIISSVFLQHFTQFLYDFDGILT